MLFSVIFFLDEGLCMCLNKLALRAGLPQVRSLLYPGSGCLFPDVLDLNLYPRLLLLHSRPPN